jgi:uncharacterized protein
VGLIYLDSCLVIYLVENHPRWGERIAGAIAKAEAACFSISSLVKCECLVGPMKRGDPVLERAYSQFFDQFALLPMPDPVYLHAARLRAHFGLRTPDALHLACAQHHGCDALWTNDDRLAQSSHGLALNILR